MQAKQRNNVVVLTLILTFTLPMVLAGLLFWSGGSLNSRTTNYGQLIQPPLSVHQLNPKDSAGNPLTDKDLLGKWVLLTLSPERCDRSCQKSLYSIRQICKATGKDQTRLRQVVLTLAQQTDPRWYTLLKKEYPLMAEWIIDQARFKELTGLQTDQQFNTAEGAIYFIDPMGNIMMRYKPSANPSRIFKDLSKLLRVSQIG